MKTALASLFALATLASVSSASACEWMEMAYTPIPAVETAATPTVKQMVMNYLQELSDEKRIA